MIKLIPIKAITSHVCLNLIKLNRAPPRIGAIIDPSEKKALYTPEALSLIISLSNSISFLVLTLSIISGSEGIKKKSVPPPSIA